MSHDPTPALAPDLSSDPALSGVTPLTQWGVIHAQGADAAKFLHGQLTQDFALLGLNEARWAAFCSPKGRVLATFVGFKRGPDSVFLLCPADVLAPTLKRLSMFVLRAQCRLRDASADWSVWGVSGHSLASATHLGPQPWQLSTEGEASWVRLYPSLGLPRAMVLAPQGHPGPAGPVLASGLWDWLEVRSAVVPVGAAMSEALVPQMLNYESVGGVNFKKGCYPGQEVVARSQFRGTLKRRAHVFHSAAALAAGDEVFHSEDAEQPCGSVVAAAPKPSGGWDAVVSVQLSALGSGSVHLGQSDGPVLTPLLLPYPLLADI